VDKQCEEMQQIDDSVTGLGFCSGAAAIPTSSRVRGRIEVLKYGYGDEDGNKMNLKTHVAMPSSSLSLSMAGGVGAVTNRNRGYT